MTKVAILGGSGYTAAELIKILLRHPDVRIEAVTSRQEGTPAVAELHPSLLGRIDLKCEPFDPDALKRRGVQCAFGCLPHGVSAECVKPLLERGIRVVDLSADYRLRDPKVFEAYYGEPPHDLANLSRAVYGLPEVYGDKIDAAELVANPGCYPQTAILGLAPLAANKLIELKGIIVNSCSGVSGAGRTPKLTTHFPECNESVSAYNVGKHRHTPEIEQALGDVAGEAGRSHLHAAPGPDGPRHLQHHLRDADAAGDGEGPDCPVPRVLREGPVRPGARIVARDQGHGAHELPRRVREGGARPGGGAGVRGQPGPRGERRRGAELQPHVWV